MVATSIQDHEATHLVDSGAPGVDRVLRTAVIYGANAAGKSNLLSAMDFVGDFVASSAKDKQAGESINVMPFGGLDGTPSTFEFTFVREKIKYQYGFSANHERVFEEWLYAFPEKRPQRWYYRTSNPNSNEDSIEFGSLLRGQKQQWRQATRPNALFLSAAVQLNSEQLRPVYDWFAKSLRVVLGTGELRENFSARAVSDSKIKSRIIDFLQSADIAIRDIEVTDQPLKDEVARIIRSVAPEHEAESIIKQGSKSIRFHHKGVDGPSFWLDFEHESQGTQRLFAYSAPLLDVLENGYVLVADELNNSLHPLLVRKIIELFNNPEVNKNGAQLVFASHATSILSSALFRRDQVWFIEKDSSGASHLYPLSDFSPRKGSSFSKGYLQGRFGAIPFISAGLIDVP